MGQLRALQEELNKLLSVGSNIRKSRFWKEGLPIRLQVYRDTIHGNAYDTLNADFPLTRKQFSKKKWLSLSVEFFKKYPPSFWELNGCIVDFPTFLKKKKIKKYIYELAVYELADLQAFIHPAIVKKGVGQSNATIQSRVFHHQIFHWAVHGAPPATPPAPKPEVLIFYRNSANEGRIRVADPLTLLLLDHFSNKGGRLEEIEGKRARMLPKNKIPLQRLLNEMVSCDLILL